MITSAIRRFSQLSMLTLLLALPLSLPGEEEQHAETLPEGLTITSVSFFPETVELTNPYASRQLLLSGTLETGE
jgi:hypothetical protein